MPSTFALAAHLDTMLCSVGSFGTVRVTTWFVAVTELRMTSFVRLSMLKFISVMIRPNENALTTLRGWPAGSLIEQLYGDACGR